MTHRGRQNQTHLALVRSSERQQGGVVVRGVAPGGQPCVPEGVLVPGEAWPTQRQVLLHLLGLGPVEVGFGALQVLLDLCRSHTAQQLFTQSYRLPFIADCRTFRPPPLLLPFKMGGDTVNFLLQ